jgi:hypothetical protein
MRSFELRFASTRFSSARLSTAAHVVVATSAFAWLSATSTLGAQDAPPSTPPQATASETAPDARKARAEAFLGELEKTATTIDSVSGAITLEKFDALVEETERRFGRIVLDRKDGKRRIAIRFDEFIDGSGRSDKSVQHFIIADGWLCEQDYKNKSFTKRQIVKPGEDFDPLALGEGPVPLPIGQKKSEVMARFDVTETELPLDVPLLGSLRDVAALRLVPKSGTPMAKDHENIDLFYDRTTLVPVGVVMREKNGNRTVARISKPVVNGEVKAEDRALLEIPTPDPKEWAIDVKPLAGSN